MKTPGKKTTTAAKTTKPDMTAESGKTKTVRKSAPKSKPKQAAGSAASTFDEHAIRKRAHAIWKQEGEPDGKAEEHWARAEQELKSELQNDDGVTNLEALKEAVREHSDVYLVKTDLEDAEQRDNISGSPEQP